MHLHVHEPRNQVPDYHSELRAVQILGRYVQDTRESVVDQIGGCVARAENLRMCVGYDSHTAVQMYVHVQVQIM